jgi:hypothetical protein
VKVSTTTAQNKGKDEFHELKGLVGYIDALMDSFPEPISRKELAKKTGVSQPAITKVKNRLLNLCEQNAFLFSNKLILRTDETSWKLLSFYFLQMKPTKMLLSHYGWQMIKLMNLHSKISEKIREYAFHFNEKDTEIMTRLVLYNLDNFQVVNQIRTSISDPQQRTMLLSIQYVSAAQNILQKLDLPIEKAEDLRSVLTIRDKLFYFTRDLIWQQVQKADIMRELSTEEKETYLKVYSTTIDFYLKKLFGIGTNFIKQAAQRRKLEFKKDYEKIGVFYTPLRNNANP